MLLAGLIVALVFNIRAVYKANTHPDAQEEIAVKECFSAKFIAAAIILVTYSLMLDYTGFLVATFFFFIVFAFLIGLRKPGQLVLGSAVFTPMNLLFIFIGIVQGVIFGALSGVSASMAVAPMVPFTFTLDPVGSIAFLSATYCAAITGGGIPAILFKIPGTPSSAVTTFDGYPLAQRGEAGKALLLILFASASGGIVSSFAMLLVSRQLSEIGLKFGPSELFVVGLIGLSVATMSMDPVDGVPRLTFGSSYMLGGIPMIPVMVGMFAISEVLKQVGRPPKEEDRPEMVDLKKSPMRLSWSEWWGLKWTLIRCSIVGTMVGILPGAGATIASFLGYGMEIKLSKHPEEFGKGSLVGLAASETSNNAATGGSMVPLLSLGIPGGNAAAVMVAALMLQGVQVGPILLKAQPAYLSGMFVAMIATNIMMVFIAIFVAKAFAQLMRIPYHFLGPLICLFAADHGDAPCHLRRPSCHPDVEEVQKAGGEEQGAMVSLRSGDEETGRPWRLPRFLSRVRGRGAGGVTKSAPNRRPDRVSPVRL